MANDAQRNLGIGLLVGGLVAGGFAAVLFWVASEENWNPGPTVFACLSALLGVALIGYGISKIATAGSST